MDMHSASAYYIVVYSYSSQIIQNMVKNFNVEEATSWPAISKHGLGFEFWTLKKEIMLNTYWPFNLSHTVLSINRLLIAVY